MHSVLASIANLSQMNFIRSANAVCDILSANLRGCGGARPDGALYHRASGGGRPPAWSIIDLRAPCGPKASRAAAESPGPTLSNPSSETPSGALAERRVVVGVTGGIAAYKAAELVRLLRRQGAEIQVIMTRAAGEFIGALTLQALSGRPVRQALLDPAAEQAMGHIELARWADALVIAPASADCLARLAHGRADDLLGAVHLATGAPVLAAVAMNQRMWRHPATRANCRALAERGVELLGPADGEQACGDIGPGRMLEPAELVARLAARFRSRLLDGQRVVVTAGPTHEALDPVRFLGNRSSGKMGFAIAEAAADAGARTVLIAGPVRLPTPERVRRIDVLCAEQMHRQGLRAARECEIFIAAAAVADYRPAERSEHKIRKGPSRVTLELVRNPDLLAEVGALGERPFTVGFAAETDDSIARAREKMRAKNCDMMVANAVGGETGFDSDDNEVTLLCANAETALPRASKRRIAARLIAEVAARRSDARQPG